MTGTGTSVRGERSGDAAGLLVGITGAAGPLGSAVTRHLASARGADAVVALDVDDPGIDGVAFRRVDVRDAALRSRLDGLDVVVHLATSREPGDDVEARRAVNVRGTEVLLRSAVAAGVRRVVLVTSAMVYGADPANEVPLPEDAPLRAEPDLGVVGDWLEMERLATRTARAHPQLQVVRLRPASLVGAVADPVLPRLFDAPRLLVIRGSQPWWQFCHTDDLATAVDLAVTGAVDGAVTVGCDGALDQGEVERISGMRSIVVPAAVAFATAERLRRVGVLPAPAGELRYLTAPWVVGSQRLLAAGWQPAWTNEGALSTHLEAAAAEAGRPWRRDATRAAAGTAVAVVGAMAVASARARRRRRG